MTQETVQRMRRLRRRTAVETAADRLSTLPDDLLRCIVCHLPIKEAVRMSILSRRLRRTPFLVPVVDFLNLYSFCLKKKEEILDWNEEVNGAMASVQWGLIRRCWLYLPYWLRIGEPVLDSWARALAGRGIQELMLSVSGDAIDATSVLHHCSSLTTLKLRKCVLTGGTAAGALRLRCTHLRKLRLMNVHISNDLLQDIVGTCLHLDELQLSCCSGLTDLRINAAPSLRFLSFDFNGAVNVNALNVERAFIRVMPGCKKFTFRAPKLATLSIYLNAQDLQIVAKELRSFIKNATNLLFLRLHGSSFKSLFSPPWLSLNSAPGSLFPSFRSLTGLFIMLCLRDNEQSSCLAKLLQHCSCLRHLELSMTEHVPSPNEVPFLSVVLFSEHQRLLEKMGCLSGNLQKVTMFGLTGEIYEMKLACFLLMAARGLKMLSLHFRKQYAKAMDTTAKHLPTLIKGSPEAEWGLHQMSF